MKYDNFYFVSVRICDNTCIWNGILNSAILIWQIAYSSNWCYTSWSLTDQKHQPVCPVHGVLILLKFIKILFSGRLQRLSKTNEPRADNIIADTLSWHKNDSLILFDIPHRITKLHLTRCTRSESMKAFLWIMALPWTIRLSRKVIFEHITSRMRDRSISQHYYYQKAVLTHFTVTNRHQ